jgi:hypothetical protein
MYRRMRRKGIVIVLCHAPHAFRVHSSRLHHHHHQKSLWIQSRGHRIAGALIEFQSVGEKEEHSVSDCTDLAEGLSARISREEAHHCITLTSIM